MMKNMITSIMTVVMVWLVIGSVIMVYKYTQRLIQNNPAVTATGGIWFTKTVDLTQYRQIGTGDGLYGKYRMVTRSVTQGNNEHLEIYFK